MKVKIADIECSLMKFGALVDCEPMICNLCKNHQPGDFRFEEVTPKELVDLIKSFHYVICIK